MLRLYRFDRESFAIFHLPNDRIHHEWIWDNHCPARVSNVDRPSCLWKWREDVLQLEYSHTFEYIGIIINEKDRIELWIKTKIKVSFRGFNRWSHLFGYRLIGFNGAKWRRKKGSRWFPSYSKKKHENCSRSILHYQRIPYSAWIARISSSCKVKFGV